MLRKNLRWLVALCCFWFVITSVRAQYAVTGGKGIPLLAATETAQKLEVYLVYGIQDAAIGFTSSSLRHQWYRYRTSIADKEPVSAEQNGNTSVIRNLEEGYGYFVEEEGVLPHFVWIIDYSKYAFELQSLFVAGGNCAGMYLGGTPEIKPMRYFLPYDGKSRDLEREFEVSYQTLEYKDEDKLFSEYTVTNKVKGNVLSKNVMLEAPLCDTQVTLRGDLFARHFNVEQTMTTDVYQAVAVFAVADTTVVMDEAPNLTNDGSDMLSAPVDIHFRARANDPVASLFTWTIYRTEAPDNPLVQFLGEEVDYTFTQAGEYTAQLDVSDRTSECSDNSNVFTIKITDSFLDVPNAFSPGTTPGINDEFRVAYKSIVSYKCWIFNRWGVEMYRSTNPAAGWDGKKGGKYVPPGVYFYVIEAKGSDGISWNKKGSINILRPKTVDEEVQQ